ncbi:sigma-70 family RNA polymerase sigma factor [bacterium]|nr:sigma-70 family RNA polymerase sigma factor [bacterium]
MNTVQTEQEIAHALRNSDKTALKALYTQYYVPITEFLFYRVRNRDEAEDLAQDTFFRLWQSRDKINPDKSLKSYLYQIANNLFIDQVRRKKIERRYTEGQSRVSPQGPEIETGITVQMAIDRLPEKLRTVFILSRAEGFSHKEISETLNISRKTAEHRIYRALEQLQKELKE